MNWISDGRREKLHDGSEDCACMTNLYRVCQVESVCEPPSTWALHMRAYEKLFIRIASDWSNWMWQISDFVIVQFIYFVNNTSRLPISQENYLHADMHWKKIEPIDTALKRPLLELRLRYDNLIFQFYFFTSIKLIANNLHYLLILTHCTKLHARKLFAHTARDEFSSLEENVCATSRSNILHTCIATTTAEKKYLFFEPYLCRGITVSMNRHMVLWFCHRIVSACVVAAAVVLFLLCTRLFRCIIEFSILHTNYFSIIPLHALILHYHHSHTHRHRINMQHLAGIECHAMSARFDCVLFRETASARGRRIYQLLVEHVYAKCTAFWLGRCPAR